jgi:hypothetical protein
MLIKSKVMLSKWTVPAGCGEFYLAKFSQQDVKFSQPDMVKHPL